MPPASSPQEQQRRATARLVLHSAPITTLFAAAAATVTYLAARAAGASMPVPVDPNDPGSALVHVGLTGVVLSSVFPAFIGSIALALLTRTSRPMTWFLALAAALVLLAAGPLLLPRDPGTLRIDAGTRYALAAIHAVRAAAVVWTLSRALRARAPAGQ